MCIAGAVGSARRGLPGLLQAAGRQEQMQADDSMIGQQFGQTNIGGGQTRSSKQASSINTPAGITSASGAKLRKARSARL